MQKVIIASSMVVLASGATVPRHQAKKIEAQAMTSLKAQMKGMQTQSANTAVAPTSLSADAVFSLRGRRGGKGKGKGKDKGGDDDNKDEDGGKYFEMSFGLADCEDGRAHTSGFSLGQCLNYVDKNENDEGLPRSHRFVEGETGLLQAEAFLAYDCQGTPAAITDIDLTRAGFGSDYVYGTCIDLGGYFGKAIYTDEMHYPNYDAILDGEAVSPDSCKDHNFIEYEIIRTTSGACQEDEGEYFTMDLTNCESGSITYNAFSDDACTNLAGSIELRANECLLELDDFITGINEEGTGYFKYVAGDCHVESVA